MTRLPFCALVLLLSSGFVGTATAQVVQPPPGSARGMFGGGPTGPDSPGLTLTIDVDGGYDDYKSTDVETPGGEPYQPFQSGYVATAGGTLRYQRGSIDKFLLGIGSGSVSQQQLAPGQSFYQLLRGDAGVQAATRLGGRSGLTVAGGVGYDPTYLFGAFDSLDRIGGVENPLEDRLPPTADPAFSLTAQRWLTSRAAAGVHRNLTSRQRLNVQYAGLWVQPVSGPGYQSQTHSVDVTHAWAAFPASGFELAYRFNHNAQTLEDTLEQPTQVPPVDTHTMEGQYRHDRRLSTDRTISFMVGGGVVGLGRRTPGEGAIIEHVLPTASGSVGLRFLPTWSVSLGARHDVTVLDGLSAEPFASDAATLTFTGTAWQRLAMAVTGGYSQGRAFGSAAGDFDQTIVNGQLTYGFGSRVGVFAGYAFNTHVLRDVTLGTSSFPTESRRHSVRVGLTMWLPLYGSF